MASRKLVIFEHATRLGNAPAHKLFDLVTAKRIDESKPPRAFSDYSITINHAEKPEGVTITER
jgi:CRISPR-associated protein Csd2